MPKARLKVWEKDYLQKIVNESFRIGEVLQKLGLSTHAGQYRQFHRYIAEYDIDTSHFKNTPADRAKLANHIKVEYSQLQTSRAIKERIIKDNLMDYKCAGCGINSWQTSTEISDNNQLILQLDHIDGNPLNNDLLNLRFLCPNCHSKTKTFGARKLKGPVKPDNLCSGCGIVIYKDSINCTKCNRVTKINWPSNEELLQKLEAMPYTILAKELGVSDNAIRTRLKRSGITPPKKWVRSKM